MADEKLNILTLAMAKKYTDNSLAGAGAVAGVPCQIQSITPITGGNRVTFLWEDNNNVSHTSTLDIMDGAGGEENKIDSISVNGSPISIDENKNVDITVPSIEGLTKDVDLATVAKSGDYEDLANKPEIPSVEGLAKTTDIPTKVSQLENDSNYLSSIPEEYVTDTELEAKGYLTEHQDISNLVEKEDGKGLSSNDYTTEEKNKLAGLENYNDTALSNRVKSVEDEVPNLATKTYVGEQIANAEHLKREIVTVLPSDEEASDNVIYMLKIESATGNDKYQEYMKIDGTVQMVGDTSVDLTDYAKSVDIPTTVAELTDSADYAKKTDLHSHTNKTVLDGITSTKVSNWDSAKTHADSAHAPSNAQANVIESVKVNGSALSVSNKSVNIDLSGYARNDNLDTLEFGEVAGGKNLVYKTINNANIDVNGTILGSTSTEYNLHVAKVENGKTYTLTADEVTYALYSVEPNINVQSYDKTRVTNGSKTITIPSGVNYIAFRTLSTYSSPMIEEGTTATDYEPYIPSVKMLYDKTTQIDDLNMLGWVVPDKMSVRNYKNSDVFYQKVNRINLSNFTWTYDTTNKFWYSTNTALNNMKLGMNIPFVSDYPMTNLWHNEENIVRLYSTSTSSPSGYLYYELAEENAISIYGNEIIGGTDISSIGDGTVTGAIRTVNDNLDTLKVGKVAGGKNLVYKTIKNANIDINGTILNSESTEYNLHVAKVENGKTYTLTADGVIYALYSVEPNINVQSYDKTRVTNGSKTITIPSGVNYIAFRTLSTYSSPMIEEGTTATDYEPYIPSVKMLANEVYAQKNKLGGLTFSASGTTLSITDGTNTWTLEANS